MKRRLPWLLVVLLALSSGTLSPLRASADTLSVTTTSMPDAHGGTYYSTQLNATGGTMPYTWSIVVGSLPEGLSLDARTGWISGTPVGPPHNTTVSFTVQVTDAVGATATKGLSITVYQQVPGSGGAGPSLYTLSGFGDVTPDGSFPPVSTTASWPGWDIARGAATRPDGAGGWVLDGWGGLHPFGSNVPPVTPSGFWRGWDIARGIALTPDGNGGWVLDGWGGLHSFGDAADLTTSTYWPGWDIARGIAVDAGGGGGWVLDGWGVLHPFGDARSLNVSSSWHGWDIARGLIVTSAGGGYVLDGWGGLHQFGDALPPSGGPYWRGWDIARGVAACGSSSCSSPGGWVLDGWGGVHEFGSAPAEPATSFSQGQDIARARWDRVAGNPDGPRGIGERDPIVRGAIRPLDDVLSPKPMRLPPARKASARCHVGGWIRRGPVDAELEVDVGPGGVAGGPLQADGVADVHGLAGAH
jgi:hypothetical protein